jgi:hypothetical protein
MLRVIMLFFAVNLPSLAGARAEASCISQNKSTSYWAHYSALQVPPVDRRLIAQVLCCCKTHSGGECCTRVAQCGRELPGCFCASSSVPGVRNLSSSIQTH